MKPAPLTQKHKKALSATTKRMYEYLLQGNSLTARWCAIVWVSMHHPATG